MQTIRHLTCLALLLLLVSCGPLPPAAPAPTAGIAPTSVPPRGGTRPATEAGVETSRTGSGETPLLLPTEPITPENAHRLKRTIISSAKGRGMVAGDGGAIFSLALSPAGDIVAAGYMEGPVTLYEVSTGELLAELESEIGFIRSLAFSPDGRLLAGGGGRFVPSSQQGVQVWDVVTGEPVLLLDGFTDGVYSVAFSPNGSLLAVGWGNPWGAPGSLGLWKLPTGEPMHELKIDRSGTVFGLAFSPDGTRLAAIEGPGQARIWNVTEQAVETILTGAAGHGYSVAFSPDGKLLVTSGTSDGTDDTADLRVWNTLTGEQTILSAPRSAAVRSVAFSADGRVVAAASMDGAVRVWDVEAGKVLASLEVPFASTVALSKDGRLLATGGWADPVRIWGVAAAPSSSAGERVSAPEPAPRPRACRP